MDAETQNYLRYYSCQSGGTLDTFQGARRGQFGNGLGDILRGIFRTVLPIAAHGASTFLGEMARGKSDGQSWKESARNAVGPTAHKLVDDVVTRINPSRKVHQQMRRKKKNGLKQQGGKRRRRVRKKGIGRRTAKSYKKMRRNDHKEGLSKRIRFLNF